MPASPTPISVSIKTTNKEIKMSDESSIQYTRVNGGYVRCGMTVKTLDAGFYDIVDVGRGIFGLKPKVAVSDELIDLPGTVADDIFDDIGKFMQTGEQYKSYGLTHKRGYLFYGPPGSGKTSLGQMLAKRFIQKSNGIVVYVASACDFFESVSIMRDVEPGRPSMYLIEEADAIINNTHCLSILDGELSINGAVFVAMTNYKNRLPPRIANRPGRFDRVTLVNCPPESVQVEYLKRVEARNGSRPDAPENIVKALSGLPMSMAHLREAFISHVLMGLSLPDLRTRFEIMAGVRSDASDDTSSALAAIKHVDDDDIDYSNSENEDLIYNNKDWAPGDGKNY
jgi:energy-coupling factor transporter ATP-binding protein EcfA2